MSNARTLASTINSSSQIVVPSGGVNFGTGTDGSGTVTSGVLDDYEVGTWTPVGSGITFPNKAGFYVKIGNFVHVQGFVDFPTTTSTAGASVGGLPFTNVVDGGGFTLTLENFTGSQLTVHIPKNQSYGSFYENAVIKDNVHLSAKYFYFSGSYTTS